MSVKSRWEMRLHYFDAYYQLEHEIIERKWMESLDTIRSALANASKPYVSVSGGKDSILMLAMVQAVLPGTPGVWIDEWDTPDTWDVLDRLESYYGIKIYRCRYVDKHPEFEAYYGTLPVFNQDIPIDFTGGEFKDITRHYGFDLAFVGMRRDESKNREFTLRYQATQYLKGKEILRCAPLANWSLTETWAKTIQLQLPIHQGYGKMVDLGIPLERARIGGLTIVRVYNFGTFAAQKQLYPDVFGALIAANPCMAGDR